MSSNRRLPLLTFEHARFLANGLLNRCVEGLEYGFEDLRSGEIYLRVIIVERNSLRNENPETIQLEEDRIAESSPTESSANSGTSSFESSVDSGTSSLGPKSPNISDIAAASASTVSVAGTNSLGPKSPHISEVEDDRNRTTESSSTESGIDKTSFVGTSSLGPKSPDNSEVENDRNRTTESTSTESGIDKTSIVGTSSLGPKSPDNSEVEDDRNRTTESTSTESGIDKTSFVGTSSLGPKCPDNSEVEDDRNRTTESISTESGTDKTSFVGTSSLGPKSPDTSEIEDNNRRANTPQPEPTESILEAVNFSATYSFDSETTDTIVEDDKEMAEKMSESRKRVLDKTPAETPGSKKENIRPKIGDPRKTMHTPIKPITPKRVSLTPTESLRRRTLALLPPPILPIKKLMTAEPAKSPTTTDNKQSGSRKRGASPIRSTYNLRSHKKPFLTVDQLTASFQPGVSRGKTRFSAVWPKKQKVDQNQKVSGSASDKD